jgi:hypothetical protein
VTSPSPQVKPWKKYLGYALGVLAVPIVWVVIPLILILPILAVVSGPAYVYDFWTTYVLGEKWALWTHYGTEETYNSHKASDRQQDAPRRQKSLEDCEALRVQRTQRAREMNEWWRTVGYPQCLREHEARCNLRAVEAQRHGMNYAETYGECVKYSSCGEPSPKPTEFVCRRVGDTPPEPRRRY